MLVVGNTYCDGYGNEIVIEGVSEPSAAWPVKGRYADGSVRWFSAAGRFGGRRSKADILVRLESGGAVRTYRLRRYSRRGLMAEGAEVRASSEAEAIAKARALFSEPEYRHDKFEIESVQE